MKNLSSFGDMARSFNSRLSNYSAKSRLDMLTKELTSGEKSDIGKSLNGNLSRLNDINHRLTLLGTFQSNISELESRLSAQQDSIQAIQTTTSTLGADLLAASSLDTRESLILRATHANNDFNAFVSHLNTSTDGKFVFAGIATDRAPLASGQEIASQIASLTAGMTTVTDMVAAIDNWFAAPAGSGGFVDNAYFGTISMSTSTPISTGNSIETSIDASADAFKETMKGYALLSIAQSRPDDFSTESLRAMVASAGENIIQGNAKMTELRGHIGFQQEAADKAKTQNGAQYLTLQIKKSELVGIDPYEAAIAVKDAETNLQNLYLVTARMSSMKLSDYLK